MLNKLRDLQQDINRVGLGGIVKSIQTPRMGAVVDNEPLHINEKYIEMIYDEDIYSVSRDLFVSGFYSQAVEECYKFLDRYIKKKSKSNLSGTKLMEAVFSPNGPTLKLNALSTTSEIDEQAGYHRLFSGAMIGIRNPCAHEIGWFANEQLALEAIIFAQHLLQKVKASIL